MTNNIKKKKGSVSVVILNYNRPKLVHNLISILLKNDNIKEIILSNGKNETKLEYNNSIIKVFDDYGENNEKYGLHLRFLRAQSALYNKVLIIDDDIIPTQSVLNKLISIDTDVMVGYYGRVIPYSDNFNKKTNTYVPIILTKFMLINKSLADMYMKIISEESELIDILKMGKPWGNGEDILISALSIYITGKPNICLRLPNIKDVGNSCPYAVCKRNGVKEHYNYRMMLCKFLFKNSKELTNNIKSFLTTTLFNIKIDWVVGWINPDQISKSIKKKYNIQRIRDNNELLYCLKSIYKYASWINKIYIILGADSLPPSWLKETSKIVLIQETSLYSPIQENSETKKLFYADIPNLSEYFIVGDDDYCLGNYIYQKDFFCWDGKPIINSVHNNWDGFGHIPIAWNKTSYKTAVFNMDNNKLEAYKNQKFNRKNPWKEIKTYLLNNNLAVKGNIIGPNIWIKNERNTIQLFKRIINTHPKFICINDDWEKNDKKKYNEQIKYLNNFYLKFYPEKYDFEK